jgi:putative ABC transport system permease protein
VSTGYFRTLGISLISGREFSDRDSADAPGVAIINSDLARTHFPNQDPLGKRITFDEGKSWLSIVGVVEDVKQLGLDSKFNPEVYFPYPQATSSSASIVVRTASTPMNLVATVKSQIQEIDGDLPVADVKTMGQLLSNSLSGRRFNTMLLTIFAVVALVLAAVGIFGVMSYSVSQRTHEIGIRMALGARASEVLSLVIRQGMMVTLVGLGVGVGASLLLTRLFEVAPTDPITFVTVSLILAGVALGACFVPARRAAEVDPMVALRYE